MLYVRVNYYLLDIIRRREGRDAPEPDGGDEGADEGEDDDGAEVAEEVFLLHLVPRVEDDRREQEVEEQRVVECLCLFVIMDIHK